ncbi:unnamed protein product [Sympodiomycopsis kandeliae]
MTDLRRSSRVKNSVLTSHKGTDAEQNVKVAGQKTSSANAIPASAKLNKVKQEDVEPDAVPPATKRRRRNQDAEKAEAVVVKQDGVRRAKSTAKVKTEDGQMPTISQDDHIETDVDSALASALPSLSDTEMYAFEGRSHWVGAHMSVSGGVENSILNARLYGCQAWALFLKPKMKWDCKPLTEDNVRLFTEWMTKFKYNDTRRCLPHGSYLVNLANPDLEKREKSLDAFIDDLYRCALLNIGLYNFHPGSGVNECTRQEACTHVANCINRAHSAFEDARSGDRLHGLTCPTILLENMAGQGHQVGSTFQELADVISQVKDKSKVGVCIDTAHAFASGMDIRTKEGYESMMKEFEDIIGLQYLKGMHLNDSLTPLNSRKDRHANLGNGQVGLTPFHCIMNDARLKHMPLVLETPAASWKVWQGEIQALYALQGLKSREEDLNEWTAIEEKLKALNKIEKEMEKGTSLAEGSEAARRALEGKKPRRKSVKKEVEGSDHEHKVKSGIKKTKVPKAQFHDQQGQEAKTQHKKSLNPKPRRTRSQSPTTPSPSGNVNHVVPEIPSFPRLRFQTSKGLNWLRSLELYSGL